MSGPEGSSTKREVPGAAGLPGFLIFTVYKKALALCQSFFVCNKVVKLRCLLLGNQEDEDQGADQQHIRIGQVGDDLKGADGESQLSGSSDGYQHLSTVRNDALEDTGESI